MIIAKRLSIFQKNTSSRIDYTHVERLETKDGFLYITGETDIALYNMRGIVHDKYFIKDLEHMYVDWYIPKI